MRVDLGSRRVCGACYGAHMHYNLLSSALGGIAGHGQACELKCLMQQTSVRMACTESHCLHNFDG